MENCGITAAEGGCKPRQAPDPAAAQTPAGGMNPAPTDRVNPAANRKPCATATHVGDDARIVPGTLWQRKTPREDHDPPLQTPANARPNGMAPRTRTAVGRDALIPPYPAAAQTLAGGMNPAPTDRGNPAANRKPRVAATHVGAHIVRPGNPAANRNPRVAATHVGDDARIVPGTPRQRKAPREDHDPPLQTPANTRSNRRNTSLGAAVGRDALIPPHPAAAQTRVGADSISARLVSAQGLVPAYPMRGGKSEPNWDAVNPCEKGCESLPLLLRSERRMANRLPFIQYLYRPYLNLTPR